MEGKELTEATKRFATKMHKCQKDKQGKPYILHPIAVAEMVEPSGPEAVAVAYLHDVVEDCAVSVDTIFGEFGLDIGIAVDAISRRVNEKYDDYIIRCGENPLARIVKIADLEHNLSPERFIPEMRGLANRYNKALLYLFKLELKEGKKLK